ncbi:adenylyltransferase/cytidyltransferase family protein [Eubacterium oxidoreducens]|uniref:Glycerol-3-phosphate cytidylyltransferase n=1 Tax=Eubacterium oxidoreducens TaxID=1732 RepID=A0A1G6B528_EUBOX|nr:glycerol-3-phosphate cytidylyltransferase [Eubacterium oxidoreducens]
MKKYRVGYTTGVFDLFHKGHLEILKKSKELCETLIVGVSTDELVMQYKGHMPIVSLEERMEIVKSIRYVDKVVVQQSMDKAEAYQKLHFDVLFHGSDWKGSKMYEDVENKMQSLGVEVVYFPYTKNVSSTMLRDKINPSGQKRIVFPSGNMAKKYLTIEQLEHVDYFINSDPAVQGSHFYGKKIEAPEKLKEEDPDKIVVFIVNELYYDEIAQLLRSYGLKENVHFFKGYELGEEYYLCKKQQWVQLEGQEQDVFQNNCWGKRAKAAVQLLPSTVHSIADIGCGDEKLRKILPNEINYFGVDYVKRSEDTIVADLNKDPLPQLDVDCYALLGVLEHLKHPERIIEQFHSPYVICSYRGIDSYQKLWNEFEREQPFWGEHFYSYDYFCGLFFAQGYRMSNLRRYADGRYIFVFEKNMIGEE